ncbi:MAG: prephenate dehydrogenase [Brevinema sp.]
MISTVYIAGLGLIGGSIAKKLSTFSNFRILGEDNNAATQAESGLYAQALEEADIIFLCLPPSMVGDYLKKNLSLFKKGAIIANCAGVQSHFFEEWGILFERGVELIGAHPMMGSEKAGFSHSDSHLFEGGSLILCVTEKNNPEALLDTTNFLKEYLGFHHIYVTDPQKHDSAMAFVSQLPHVLSVLLMQAQPDDVAQFAGTSLKEMTRIAEINTKLWTDLFLENKNPLIEVLQCYENKLSEFKNMLIEENQKGLEAILNQSTEKKSLFFSKKG